MSAPTIDALADLSPIGLLELVARAELLTRVDRKYVLPLAQAHRLVEALPSGTRVLDIDGRRQFGYRSTYLDTPQRHSYLGAGRSHRRRWKVRTRTYLDSDATWLEVKTRSSRSRTLKQRVEHPDAHEGEGLTASGRAFVGAIIGHEPAVAARPVLVTAYRRSTLFLASSNSRATLDVGLGWTSLSHEREVRDLDRPSLAIVETKTGATPSAVDRLLWEHGHRPVRISKYGVGMAALDPSLPRLKWHHALDRHLGLPRAARSLRGNPL